MLRGMFAFIIYDRASKSFVAFRDHVGIVPLYLGYGRDGSIWVASEMKALASECARFQKFLPGHYFSSITVQFIPWYKPQWREISAAKTPYDPAAIRNAFILSVKRRMMADVPWGVLLSGGLDSSLFASVACRLMKEAQEGTLEGSHSHTTWFPRIHSFCVGLEGSPDFKAADRVAKFLGTIHHSYSYTLQEGLDAVSECIYHLETFDVTTVRASTQMFLMSRRIKAMGIKMVLSGEGSDEIFAGYLYFHKAPNAQELQAELIDKVTFYLLRCNSGQHYANYDPLEQCFSFLNEYINSYFMSAQVANLHMFDCLRANKSTSAWGLEARVPFLDVDFIDLVMSLDPVEKMIRPRGLSDGSGDKAHIEKYILRQAFDTPEDPFLPADILWRQKEQFSDGVGYGWIDSLRDTAQQHVTDQMFRNAAHRFPENTPATKEAYYYRQIFERHYPQSAAVKTVPGGLSIACSTERAMQWDADFRGRADCSGRAVAGVHAAAYDELFSGADTQEATETINADCTFPPKKQKT